MSRVLHQATRSALSALTLCAAVTAAAAPPTDAAGWQAWARDDLDAIHARIVAAHPGVIDSANPGFNTWVRRGYEESQRLLPHVVSYDTALDVLIYYTSGFEDGHLLVSDDIRKDFPILVTGWNVASRDGGYVVAAVMPDWSVPLPPVGATWTGCDGQTTDAILQETVAPFLHRGGSVHGRAELAGGLWLRRPVAQGLRECTFRTPAGEELRLGVTYQPIDTARFIAARTHSRDHGDRAANDFVLDDGVLWVRAGEFNLRSDSGDVQELDRMIAGLEKVRDVRAIVFDSRGNRGGDSSVGDRIFAAATGGLEYDRSGLDALPRHYAQWRVTDYQVRVLDGILARQAALHGADSPEVAEWTAFRDRMVAALAAGERWLDRDVGPSITPAQIAARGGRLRRFDAKVALLTDDDCVSACLDFADTVRQVPGVVHVGETTGADSVYMMGSRAPLPSGNHLIMPVKVWRGRMRGDNEPYVPDVAVDLEQDEAGIRRDVLRALVPSAGPGV